MDESDDDVVIVDLDQSTKKRKAAEMEETFKNSDIYACFFKPISVDDPRNKDKKDNAHICLCNSVYIQDRQAGKGNLVKHVKSVHKKDYVDKMITFLQVRKEVKAKGGTLQFTPTIPPEAKNIYGWIDFINGQDLPFNTCENNHYLKYTNLSKISVETLQDYMHEVGNKILNKITTEVEDGIYGLVFDGWSDGNGSHYVAVFIVFPNKDGKCT